MEKKFFCKSFILCVFTLLNLVFAVDSDKEKGKMECVLGKQNEVQITSPDKVKVRGDLVDRMRLAVGALDKAGRFQVWSGFRHELTPGHSEGMWCADWPGRTLEAYSRTAMSLGEMATPRYDEVAWGLLSHQEKDGAFHNGEPVGGEYAGMASDMLAKENGFWFGNARGLLGYIWADRYEGENSKFRQPSAELGNYFTETFFTKEPQKSPFLWCATEALTELYRSTKDEKYLMMAAKIGKEIPTVDRNSSMHTHSYILSLRGVVRACQEMGPTDECNDLMKTVMTSYHYITGHVMWPGGGIIEHLSTKESYIPDYCYDECCSVCDWLGLNLDLWRTTLKSDYMDMAERVALNHLLYDQDASGGFCGDRGVDFVREGSPWPFCCSMHGTRTLSELTQYIAMTDGKDVYINLFYPSVTQLEVNGKSLKVDLETNYPNDGKLKLTLEPSGTMVFPLKIRIPAWSNVKSASIDGRRLSQTAAEDGYLVIEKKWQKGDIVELVLDMPYRTEKRNEFVGNDASTDMSRVSLWKGPRQLVYNQELNNHLWKVADVRPALRYVYQTYEELQFDQSVKGTPLKIVDKAYEKGLGVHTVSEIVYALDGQFKEFISDIGVDASAGDKGAVRFKVCVDGVVKSGEVVRAGMAKDNDDMVETLYGFQVAAMTSKDAAKTIRLNVENATVLRLCVDDGVNGLRNDYADWADARLIKADGTVVYLSDLPDDRKQGVPLDWGKVVLEEVDDSGQSDNVVSLAYKFKDQTVPIRFNCLSDLGYSLISHRPVLSSYVKID